MALPVLRRWGPWHLLLAWGIYWLALIVGVLARPASLAWRLTHDPASHGRVTAKLANDVVSLIVTEGAATRWSGRASILTLALWFVVPPLLLYVAWLRSRPARRVVGAGEVLPHVVERPHAPPGLPLPPPVSPRVSPRTPAE